MKTTTFLASLAIAGSLSVGALADTTTNDWWSVDFQDITMEGLTAETGLPSTGTNVGGTFTTFESNASAIVDGTETYGKESMVLALDTQGENFVFTPGTSPKADYNSVLVDADVYFVGSDTAPDPSSFDADENKPVQSAVFLKNELAEDGTVSSSQLYVYMYDGEKIANTWLALSAEGVEIKDKTWHNLKMTMDYSENTYWVTVQVDNTTMSDDDGNTKFQVANVTKFIDNQTKLSAVAFRGTGAVDNFVGKALKAEGADSYNYAGVTFDAAGKVVSDVMTYTSVAGVEVSSDAIYPVTGDLETGMTAVEVLDKIEVYAADGSYTTWTFIVEPKVLSNEGGNFLSATITGADPETTAALGEGGVITFVETDAVLTFTMKTYEPGDNSATLNGDNLLYKVYFKAVGGSVTPTLPEPSVVEELKNGVDVGAGSGTGGAVVDGEGNEVAPTEMTEDGFTLRINAPVAGYTYSLVESADLSASNDAWTVTGTPVTTTENGQLVELTAGESSSTTRFFKIKVSAPAAETTPAE